MYFEKGKTYAKAAKSAARGLARPGPVLHRLQPRRASDDSRQLRQCGATLRCYRTRLLRDFSERTVTLSLAL